MLIFGIIRAVKRIRFHLNDQKPRAKPVRDALAVEAARIGLSVVEDGTADAIVVLGGDGTILRAVHAYPDIPILGLNLGGLGYLSSVEERDFTRALDMLARGAYRISERSMLSVRTGDGKWFPALNDVVADRVMSGHTAILDLAMDGKSVTRYLADGLIIATPTGSTAYSLAAGGPVLMPDSGSFVVTPMSPHALAVRPLVVKDSAHFTVTARRRANGAAERIGVYADGENVFMLEADESVDVVRSERCARLVELEGCDPCGVLARKLGWSGANAGYAK